MKPLNILLLLTALIAIPVINADQGLAGRSFRLEYEDEQHYEVRFTDDRATWECVKGYELGKSETDEYQLMEVDQRIYFVNWTEADGSHVDLVIDLDSKKVFSSGVSKDFKWFRKGTIVSLLSGRLTPKVSF